MTTETQPPDPAQPKLEDIEQYRMQMAGISTAAIGYWKEGDSIHPDYDTVALRDVARLYAKYDALYKAAALAAPAPQAAPVALTERLRRFLDAAAGDGLELDGVDAGELYLELFPGAFAAPQTKEPTNDR